jgi:hypothetical protein
MTITAPTLIEPESSDNAAPLPADPWSDNWTFPTAEELKAVGWPGARPLLVVDVREVDSEPAAVDETDRSDPHSVPAEQIDESKAATPAAQLEQPPAPPV